MSIDPQPLDSENRDSFWSIERKNRLSFSFWFSLFFFVSVLVVCLYHIFYKDNGFTVSAFVKIAEVFVPTGLFAFTLTFLIFEIKNAIKYINLKLEERSRKPIKEGRQEVLDWLAEEHPEIKPPSHLSE